MVLGGQRALARTYNQDIRKRIARGRRAVVSAATTTEAEVLRIDGVRLRANHIYTFHTSSLLVQSTVANDVVVTKIRVSTTGTATIASSTDLGEGARRVTGASALEETNAKVSYVRTTDEVASVLLTVARGTGTGSVSIYGASNALIELYVDYGGLDPGDTGVSL